MGSSISNFIVLSPITIIYCLGFTELCYFPFKIQILQETILQWLLPQLRNCLQTKHNNAFRIYGTVDKLFNRNSCINSFTETGERPLPTRLRGTSTRSDRGPIEPGDLNTFTIAAVTLKEHNLIDEKHKKIGKRGKFSAISLGSSRVNTSRGWWKWNFVIERLTLRLTS